MQDLPFISICIPAYKRIDFLERLLGSLVIQQYRRFEVVLTDDSPDETVKRLCESYDGRLPIRYFRNAQPLGTPGNWNESVRRATGEWIKIMHDDDWFTDANSLGDYVEAVRQHPSATFLFSAYRNVVIDLDFGSEVVLSRRELSALRRDKMVLFARNSIGPPSVVLYKRLPGVEFDPKLKWLVDIDFYLRYPDGSKPAYVFRPLVNIGVGVEQVTSVSFRQRAVEIPEYFRVLEKIGYGSLRRLVVYDAWWRLMRNLGIRSPADIAGAGYTGAVPSTILSMIRWQRAFPLRWWRIGVLSKTGMFLNYVVNRRSLTAG